MFVYLEDRWKKPKNFEHWEKYFWKVTALAAQGCELLLDRRVDQKADGLWAIGAVSSGSWYKTTFGGQP